MQRDEVGLLEHILDRQQLHRAQRPRLLVIDTRAVEEDHLHAEPKMRAAGHCLADPPHADDADRLAGHLGADHVGRAPALPFAGAKLAFALAGAAGNG